jgi:TolB-like protein
MEKLDTNRSFQRYLASLAKTPKLFIADIQNDTSEAYFPSGDFNDEFLEKLSETGDYVIIDNNSRDRLLKEITYQNDGMVKESDIKKIGKASGADVLIFGNIRMKPETLKGKTIKDYSINIRITNIETQEEVFRGRCQVNKSSVRKGKGW